MENRNSLLEGEDKKIGFDHRIRRQEKNIAEKNEYIKQKNERESQEISLDRFGTAFSYLLENVAIYELCWRDIKEGETYVKSVMNYLVKNATMVKDGKVILDRTMIKHAKGKLLNGKNLKAELIKGKRIYFTWEYIDSIDINEPNDVFCVVCCKTDGLKADMYFTGAEKRVCAYVYKIPPKFDGKEVAVYGFFMRERTNDVSDDKFLGLFKV